MSGIEDLTDEYWRLMGSDRRESYIQMLRKIKALNGAEIGVYSLLDLKTCNSTGEVAKKYIQIRSLRYSKLIEIIDAEKNMTVGDGYLVQVQHNGDKTIKPILTNDGEQRLRDYDNKSKENPPA